ncbi:MAG TPA: hypothetical protein VNW71_17635 [Thermoanaerobaculia bacterium]|nr:hypothetical protein [Thermoanaerobaculia bacterium]
MRLKSYSGKINAWEVLVTSLLARLAEWPFLEPLYNELVALVADLRVLVLQQEAARAQFHEAVGRRQEMERRGADLRTRLAAHLKAQLGFRNDQLRQFGLNPLPRATRRKIEEEPAPEITALSEVEAD